MKKCHIIQIKFDISESISILVLLETENQTQTICFLYVFTLRMGQSKFLLIMSTVELIGFFFWEIF